MLVLATGVTQATNDKEQVAPMLQTLQAQAPQLGAPRTLIADTGYYSEKNILACEEANITPLIAVAREDHHPHWRERHTEPPPLPEGATPHQTMAHSLKTLAGAAAYALRKQTVEPVFGVNQVGDGFSSVLPARFEEGDRGVESGVPGVECEAHGRIASKNPLKGEITMRNRQIHRNITQTAYFF